MGKLYVHFFILNELSYLRCYKKCIDELTLYLKQKSLVKNTNKFYFKTLCKLDIKMFVVFEATEGFKSHLDAYFSNLVMKTLLFFIYIKSRRTMVVRNPGGFGFI